MRRLVLLALAALSFSLRAGAEENRLALAVKAAYLVKFEPFVSWPASSFPDTGSPFTLCVAAPDPFGPVLDRAADGMSIQNRPVLVRRLTDGAAADGCQMLFAASPDPRVLHRALDSVRGRPVLTVTDSAPGDGERGMINFMVIDDRVRFTIDDDAAALSGLAISSKLLSLAVSVRHAETKE